jgi:predicted RNase H-like nuclease
MHYVGVDLAWGERSPTGVAALDREGRLQHIGVAGDDADVLAQLEPYVKGACVVAIDAPLVVSNPTGNRPCEAALNRDFRRFDAGTHPANTGLPWFADGGRGARLRAALPAATTFEVYPHAASVVLFGLGKTLKYKQKPGRDVELLRSELLRLMVFLEGLGAAEPRLDVSTHPGWSAMKTSVTTATRKAQLRKAEDPVDAVLCAYIARYATERPDDVTIYGEETTGCIVTPTYRPCPSLR